MSSRPGTGYETARRLPLAAALGLAFIAALPAGTAHAQGMVQAIPAEEIRDLSEALGRLARNPRDLSALIAAGDASLQVDDIDAAIGFFGRADDLSPGNPRVKAGLAGAYVRSGRPLEAMELFAEAQAAGGSSGMMAADRGLAFDLIGDQPRAQEEYARALAFRRSDEVLRRLALSQAISGDRRRFETTLTPLIAQRDFAAYRIRAFGLAILGDLDEAGEIVRAVMPGDTAGRMAPFFAMMPRLTAAQQASAANLGMFPSASEMGRDDSQFAQFRTGSSSNVLRRAEERLAPAGPALGSTETRQARAEPVEQRRRPGRGAASSGTRRADLRAASDPLMRTDSSRRERVAVAEPSPAVAAAPEQRAAEPLSTPAPLPAPPVVVARAGSAGGELPAANAPTARPSATVILPEETQTPAAEPGFDLAQAAPGRATLSPPASVSEAFGTFTLPETALAARAPDAVDITAIKPPREVAELPKAEPAPPAHPSRVWVQVATGRDRSALRFDWRRISRKAPAVLGGNGPFVTPWGEANRLLAGPFASQAEARSAVNALKEEGVDSFTFTSPQGQEIEQLR